MMNFHFAVLNHGFTFLLGPLVWVSHVEDLVGTSECVYIYCWLWW